MSVTHDPERLLSAAFALTKTHLARAKSPLLVLLGPTASGKTALSVALAKRVTAECGRPCEIINADSRQLYRTLCIGTAKVTSAEMQGVPHHLLDVLDPSEPVTAAWYQERAYVAIDDVLSRGAVPLLVGGSMLYLSAVVDGFSFVETDASSRAVLENRLASEGADVLWEELRSLDPEAAATVDRRNGVYLVRALEIAMQLGSVAGQKQKQAPRYDVLQLGLAWPREELTKRIALRTEQMFAAGWTEEVRMLLAEGIAPNAPALISHGYREIVAWLQAGAHEEALSELKKSIVSQSCAYAKRQMTWWKRDGRIAWL